MTGRNKFRVFLEQAPDAFFAHDLQGRITDVNHNACVNLGYTSQELLGMSVLDIEQDFDLPSATALWAEIEPGKTRQFMGVYRRKDSTTFPVEIHATGVMQEAKKTIFALVRDISARLLVENRLERQSKLYQALSEVNQAIVRMKDETVEAGTRLHRSNTRQLKPSQRCSGCWEIVPKTLAKRVHVCPHCGHRMQRDQNSALMVLMDAHTPGTGVAARPKPLARQRAKSRSVPRETPATTTQEV